MPIEIKKCNPDYEKRNKRDENPKGDYAKGNHWQLVD